MSVATSDSAFPPHSKACARCAHWSGARRPMPGASGVIVMANGSSAARARCGVSSMGRSATEACSRFQSAFS